MEKNYEVIDSAITKLWTIRYDLKNLKKEEEILNNDIKNYLKINNVNSYCNNLNYTIELTESKSFSYDEDKLLEIISELPKEVRDKVITLVPKIDMKELERLIATETIKVDVLKPAESIKVVEKLVFKKAKKGDPK